MEARQLPDAVMMTTLGVWKGLWAKIIAFVPNLVAAVIILAVGYVVSRLLQKLGTALLQRVGFDRVSARVGLEDILARGNVHATASEIVGHVVFWLFMLTFLISATEALGLPNVSGTIGALVRYLPNVIGAAVIVVVGLTVAHFVRDLVRGGAETLGADYGRALGGLVYGVLVLVVASLAIGQLQIETVLFNRVVQIALIAAGLALALALGLGTRSIAMHIVAGAYVREMLTPGALVSVGDITGSLQEVGTIVTRLRAADGRTVYIPNGQLTETVVSQSSE